MYYVVYGCPIREDTTHKTLAIPYNKSGFIFCNKWPCETRLFITMWWQGCYNLVGRLRLGGKHANSMVLTILQPCQWVITMPLQLQMNNL